MAPRLLSLLLTVLIAGAALLLGLAGTTLRTGWMDPLDWLLPGTAAMLALAALRGGGRRGGMAWLWGLVALPMLALLGTAGGRLPWAGMALLGGGLALVALGYGHSRQWGRRTRAIALAGLLLAAFLAPHLVTILRAGGEAGGPKPVVGVLSAMPLQGAPMGAAQGLPPMESAGLRSPLWAGLESRFSLRPLDALTDGALQPQRTLLLAQPRGLAPEELVALDAWVRRGGRAVILADPLLHWPDPRPLGHPARAPLTSLLDPLLRHWGLRLEPAELEMGSDPTERRVLASGALMQVAGASRFSPGGGGGACALAEQGLVARCRVGTGQALLVADADWINDELWTLRPGDPRDRTAWTSDALDLLSAWLRGGEMRVGTLGTWLRDEESLVAGVRAALALLLILALADALVAPRPSPARPGGETEADQKWNRSDTRFDTG